MWSARLLRPEAVRTSAASPAAAPGAAPRRPLQPHRPHASRKPLAMSLGIALYAASLVLWWLYVRDGASPLGPLQQLAARADDSAEGPAAPDPPRPVRVPTYKCLGWRQTGGCGPDGPREPAADRPCGSPIRGGASGYCALEDAETGEQVRALLANCSSVRRDVTFTCSQAADLARLPHELDRAVAQARRDAAPLVPSAAVRDGIVMVVYPKLLVSAHAVVRTLRALGCTLPVELWYSERELGRSAASHPVLRSLLADFGPLTLERIADDAVPGGGRAFGFAAKVFAVTHSSLDRLLFLDADNVPVRDPSVLFSTSAGFLATGAVFWPDLWHPRRSIFNVHSESLLWEVLGSPFVDMFEQESGQLLVDTRAARASGALAALELLAFREPNPLAKLRLVHGDKDLFRLAWLKARAPFHMAPHPPAIAGYERNPRVPGGRFCGMTMAQFDPDAPADAGPAAVLFLHRNANKLTGSEDPERGRLWTHLQRFVFPAGVDARDPRQAYRHASEHFHVDIRGSAGAKAARTTMCYSGDGHGTTNHFAIERMDDALPWSVRELEDSLLAFAREAAQLGREDPQPSATVRNRPQPSPTIRNRPQPSATGDVAS